MTETIDFCSEDTELAEKSAMAMIAKFCNRIGESDETRHRLTENFISALRANVGGKTTHEEKKLKFVHKMSNGKHIQITIPKAQMTGEFNIPFSEEAYTEIPVSFTAIGDVTLAKGTQLFKIVKER